MDAVIITVFLCIAFGAGFRTGWMRQINYKKRWQEALDLLKQEKLATENLKEITPPADLPTYLQDKEFVPAQLTRENNADQAPKRRAVMELQRLSKGLPPIDTMGGAKGYYWELIRKTQLDCGWQFDDDRVGWFKVRECDLDNFDFDQLIIDVKYHEGLKLDFHSASSIMWV